MVVDMNVLMVLAAATLAAAFVSNRRSLLMGIVTIAFALPLVNHASATWFATRGWGTIGWLVLAMAFVAAGIYSVSKPLCDPERGLVRCPDR